MYPLDDKYGHPPFLRFRFKYLSKSDSIYSNIGNSISGFQGNLKWVMYTNDSIKNFIIIPQIFNIKIEGSFYDNTNFIYIFGENKYKQLVDEAIGDIPLLAQIITISTDRRRM